MTADPNVDRRVASYMRSKRLWLRIIGLCMAGLLAIAAISCVALLDIRLGLPVDLRFAALGAIVLGVVVILVWRVVIPCVRLRKRRAISEMEHSISGLGQRLRTTDQLAAQDSSEPSRFSPALVAALREQTEKILASTNVHTLVQWSRAGRWLLWACAVGLVYLLCCVVSDRFRTGNARLIAPGRGITFTRFDVRCVPAEFGPDQTVTIRAAVRGRPIETAHLSARRLDGTWTPAPVEPVCSNQVFSWTFKPEHESFEFFVAGGDGRSEPQFVRYVEPITVQSVASRIVYPRYTRLADRLQDEAAITAVRGSRAEVEFRLSHALAVADPRMADGSVLAYEIAGTNVTVHVPVGMGKRSYTVAGRGADGLILAPVTNRVVGVEDALPKVTFEIPKKDMRVTKVWEGPVRAKALDDYGLRDLEIVLRVGDQQETLGHRLFEPDAVLALDARELARMALEKYPLSINDNLCLYARARDHRPDTNVFGVSDLVWIDIRPFKERYMMGAQTGGGMMPMGMGREIRKLEQIIKLQRALVSQTFRALSCNAKDAGRGKALAKKERGLSDDVRVLKRAVAQTGVLNKDDLILLDTAAAQMTDAAGRLEKLEWRPAHTDEQAALSSLLLLRRKLLHVLVNAQEMPGMPGGEEAAGESPISPLTELAREAARLAGEEGGIHDRVDELEEMPTPLTRRQDTALGDAGELQDRLITHPEATRLALDRMQKAEDTMFEALDGMRAAERETATNRLEIAEYTLRELAEHLKGLDASRATQTLRETAQQAEAMQGNMASDQQKERSDSQEREQVSNGDAAGQRSGQSSGERGEEEQRGEREAEGRDPGSSAGEQQESGGQARRADARPPEEPRGSGPGQAGSEPGRQQGTHGEQSARQGQGQDRAPGEQAGDAADQPRGRPEGSDEQHAGSAPGAEPASAAQRDRGAADEREHQARGDGREPGRGKGEGQDGTAGRGSDEPHVPSDPAGMAERAATIHDWLARMASDTTDEQREKRLDDWMDRLKTGRLADDIRRIEQLRAQGRDEAADRLARGVRARLGELAEQARREYRHATESRLARLAAAQVEARELKDELAGSGEEAGPDARADERDGPDETQSGSDAERDGRGASGAAQDGRNGAQGEGQAEGGREDGAQAGPMIGDGARRGGDLPGGNMTQDRVLDLVADLRMLADSVLHQQADSLAKSDEGAMPDLLRKIDHRLEDLIRELVRRAYYAETEELVPPGYQRMVEEYTRALSDDMRGPAEREPNE